jgi:hypothetical protein
VRLLVVLTSSIVDVASRLFVVAEVTARYAALCGLVVGLIGYWTATSNPRRAARFRGMVVGSCAALVVIFGLSALESATVYVVGGTEFLPPEWPYGAGGGGDLFPLAQAASGVLSALGLACLSLGAALWGAGSPSSRTRTRGYHGVTYGVVMIGVSVGGTLFTVLASVFGSL